MNMNQNLFRYRESDGLSQRRKGKRFSKLDRSIQPPTGENQFFCEPKQSSQLLLVLAYMYRNPKLSVVVTIVVQKANTLPI